MNVLEDFWYGNLDPAEYDANPSKEYKELVQLISRNQMKAAEGITEALKGSDPMAWVQRMNHIRARAEEFVRKELIFV